MPNLNILFLSLSHLQLPRRFKGSLTLIVQFCKLENLRQFGVLKQEKALKYWRMHYMLYSDCFGFGAGCMLMMMNLVLTTSNWESRILKNITWRYVYHSFSEKELWCVRKPLAFVWYFHPELGFRFNSSIVLDICMIPSILVIDFTELCLR